MSNASRPICDIRKGARAASSLARSMVLALATMLATRPTVSAADFHCSAGDVPCLIAAVNTANGNGEDDTIFLEAGTYTLTAPDNNDSGPSGLPSISSNITIRGEGVSVTILDAEHGHDETTPSGLEEFRISHVAAAGDLKLEGLTVRGGIGGFGAGIFNQGALTIADSAVMDNFDGVGGIFNEGALKIRGSRIEGNSGGDGIGGGIVNSSGTMEIRTSTVSRNRAEAGGGIISDGVASITDSVIADNAEFDPFYSPGIVNNGAMTITNTTIAGNSGLGTGGGILNQGSLQIHDSTITDNDAFVDGGGINNLGTVELQNTIVARNSKGFGQGPDCFGPITSLGNNLIGDSTDCSITLLASDKTGDPGLGSFQDDGTPGNGHVPLLETSQAIDAGDPSSCTAADQLGHARADGDGNGTVICDIGAVEFIPAKVVNQLVTLVSLTQTRSQAAVPGGPAGTMTIQATFRNTSSTPVDVPFFVVAELSEGNLLLNADGGPGGVGAKLTAEVGADKLLEPGESFTAEFLVGLQSRSRFRFFVDLWGQPNP
jgi:hypothetical protein